MDREKAIDELKEVNNALTCLMDKKRALKRYIQNEDDRINGIPNPRLRSLELKKDNNFIKEHGRERTTREIAQILHYSERQINRFLKEMEKEDI